MTTEINATPATITLTDSRDFTRTEGGITQQITLGKGKRVAYRQERTDTHVIHIASYTDSDGKVWVSEVRKARQSQDVPAPSAATAAAKEATAETAANAVEAIISKRTLAMDKIENSALQLEALTKALSGKVHQLNYYIAEGCRINNPSHILRRHGFRLDGSNWVITAEGLESPAVQEIIKTWDDYRANRLPNEPALRYWIIDWTPEQLSKVKEAAKEQLAEELKDLHSSLIARIDNAAQTLQKAQEAFAEVEAAGGPVTEKDRAKAENARNGSIRSAIKEACERFEMCLLGAELFDDTGDIKSLIQSHRDAIRTEALAADAELKARGVKGVKIPASIA